MTLPFTANYTIVWKNQYGHDYIEVRKWDGAQWVQIASANSLELIISSTNDTIKFAIGTDYREVKITRGIIGNPSQIYVASFTEQQWGDYYRYFYWPSDAATEGSRSASNSISHWFGFVLTDGQSPNSGNYDRSLPVQTVSISAFAGDSKVTLVWETKNEIENAGFEIYRKSEFESDFKLIASYTTDDALKGLGTSSYGKRYTWVDRNVRNGVGYEYKIYSVSFSGQRQEIGFVYAKPGAEIPSQFVLYQNYPNPFNPGTEIKFDLPESGNVKLEVFNSLGKRVAVLYDGFMEAGYGKVVRWNASGFPSGVYYYRLTAGKYVDVKKMVLMK